MNPRDLTRLHQKLTALKTEILNEGDLAIEPGRTDPAAVGTDDDTQPLAEMSQVIASKRNRTRAETLEAVIAALRRIEQDPETFGLCSECEEPIAPRRLELLPYVELCIECQQKHDGPRSSGGRRHLRDFR